MRIGVNLLYLRPSRVGGSEVYIRELIKHLGMIGRSQLVVFCSMEVARTMETQSPVRVVPVTARPFSQLGRLLDENFTLRKALRLHPVDVLFSPANFGAPLLGTRTPQVITVHDLQHLRFKSNFSLAQRLFRSIMFRLSFMSAKHVISISEFTRKDILQSYGVSPDKVSVVLEGVDHKFQPSTHLLTEVRERFDLGTRFFYYPAAMAAHKNHLRLLDAFSMVKDRVGADLQLVFTGAKTALYESVEQRVHDLGLDHSVKHLGFVNREEVFALMTLASALLFPSDFEGFGLPLLEAMHCGTPVIASDQASIPEVTGDAAILLNPRDTEGWARAMQEILENQVLRAQLVERGYTNVGRFSWERCADQTLEVFRKCMGGTNS